MSSSDAGNEAAIFAEGYDRCPVCFGKSLKPDFSLKFRGAYTLHWDRCCSCGFTFMNPRLLPNEMSKIYATPEYWRMAYGDYLAGEPIRIENSRLRFRLCEKHMPKSGQLLDLGCATGFFAAVAAERGFDVIGVDLSSEMIRVRQEDIWNRPAGE
jgi:SAM-dependent methyltransferase